MQFQKRQNDLCLFPKQTIQYHSYPSLWSVLLLLATIGEENGNPLQCSCLENPRDGGAWWALVYGVTQSQTRLKQLSSSSSSSSNHFPVAENDTERVSNLPADTKLVSPELNKNFSPKKKKEFQSTHSTPLSCNPAEQLGRVSGPIREYKYQVVYGMWRRKR